MPTPHRRTQAHLRNLLARIHRDGGHYTEAQGLEASVAAADGIVARLWGANDELERAQKQASAMREALVLAHSESLCTDPATSASSRKYCPICKALDTGAGRGFISREQVKPLVEALQSLVSNPPIACADGQPATHAWLPPETRRAILAALSAASPAIKP